jgi:hypothetical protein
MCQILSDCCARAASGHTVVDPAITLMKIASSHELVSDEAHNLAHHQGTRVLVHCGKILLLMSVQGRVSRVSPVQTALRNCTRDEGRSFEVGNQVLISSHRKLLLSKATVVNIAEKSKQDFDRHD